MLKIDRTPPSFVSRAVGVLTGYLRPSADEQVAILACADGAEIPLRVSDGAKKQLLDNPVLLTRELDILVWPRTSKTTLEGIAVRVEPAVKFNPDRDKFLIQGLALTGGKTGKVRIGIRVNKTDRKNRSNFEQFWLTLHGHLREGRSKAVYQLLAKRKGGKLFILESHPHIRHGTKWQLLPPQTASRLAVAS